MAHQEVYPERNAEIVRLRTKGLLPREIARILGVSRNAVIGVCNRAGLSDPLRIDNVAGIHQARMEGSGPASLTVDQVREIRKRHQPRVRGATKALALEFGVNKAAICNIASRRSWAFVK